ncbi:MAG: ribosome small subunit-dependent GTPase A [Casimicrobiaceae bacterium]|nr:ribosome small subunit-dependent GTPase A [Casimicrobiaceae bacterium]MCX8099104.1 ribosome small subunit-dependent GTPase A [Casimicrobiaceae bacterium]MDW8312360.1 ribosome small subunit-dependent GTPase A [Burkholderiales bacterium]
MSETLSGLVVETQRRRSRVRLATGEELSCLSRGRDLLVVCGDQVKLRRLGPCEGVIDSVEPRSTLIYRFDGQRQKAVAANVTQIVAVVAPVPPWSEELLNRWLVCAEASGVKARIGLNKIDLPEASQALEALALYPTLGYPVIAFSAKFNANPIRTSLIGERSVLIGQSGMGKSKLLNALLGQEVQRTGEISAALETGRHTTTFTRLFTLPEGGWVIDSPGMQLFGLAHLSRAQIEAAFPEFRPWLGQCRYRNCGHRHEPGCALQEAVASGKASNKRLAYLRTFCAEADSASAH